MPFVPRSPFFRALIAIAFGAAAFLIAILDRPLVALAIGGLMLAAHWLSRCSRLVRLLAIGALFAACVFLALAWAFCCKRVF